MIDTTTTTTMTMTMTIRFHEYGDHRSHPGRSVIGALPRVALGLRWHEPWTVPDPPWTASAGVLQTPGCPPRRLHPGFILA